MRSRGKPSIIAVAPSIIAVAAVALLSACASARRPAPPVAAKPPPQPVRLALDPEISPVAFRWLADDAVLVTPEVGPRKLAVFGNYLERAGLKVEHARVAVWDDEDAWRASSRSADAGEFIAHKRALYVKSPAPPDAVERFLVFDKNGSVVYQRDFREYPLTELD
jgi:hypothetical protein